MLEDGLHMHLDLQVGWGKEGKILNFWEGHNRMLLLLRKEKYLNSEKDTTEYYYFNLQYGTFNVTA